MSPEQARGNRIDARSDIFSFGAVLYEMITGVQAFRGDDQLSILASLARDEPEKITAIAPLTPIELERVILRALRKDPERRWQSMADMKRLMAGIRETFLIQPKSRYQRTPDFGNELTQAIEARPPASVKHLRLAIILAALVALVAISVYVARSTKQRMIVGKPTASDTR